MSLDGARILVTGGAGFIGSHLVDALRTAGADVISFDLPLHDIRDPLQAEMWVDGADYVFHQAALHWKVCEEDPRGCLEVMVDGTFNVLEAAQDAGVKRVVMASSAKVYGSPTFYSAAKRAGEELARAFDVPVTVLRYFNVYGPRQKDGVIPAWRERIAKGLPPLVVGDSSADFVHVDDVVRANLLALEGPVGTYDICTGVETKLVDLAALLAPSFQWQNGTPVRSVGNPFAATNLLGFTAAITLRQGLEKMLDPDHQAVAGVGGSPSPG